MSRRSTSRSADLRGTLARIEDLLLADGRSDAFAATLDLVVDIATGRAPSDDAPVVRSCRALLAPFVSADHDLGVVDAAFEALTSRDRKGEKGQFFTPRQLVELAVRMAAPRDGDTVFDPACGSAAFLWHAARHADVTVHGVELDPRAAEAGRRLLALASARGDVEVGDALRMEHSRYDVVLSNPPFAGAIVDPELRARFVVGRGAPRVERDALFLEVAIRALRPGGRLAIVLPFGTLSHRRCTAVRTFLLRELRDLRVVGLDTTMFLPHTHQRTALVVGTKRRAPLAKPRETDEVAMISTTESGISPRGLPVVARPDEPRAWTRLAHDLSSALDASRYLTATVAALGPSRALVPQRHARDDAPAGKRLGELARLVTDGVKLGETGQIIDTGDLDRGYLRHDALSRPPSVAGSKKRRARRGDVLISRLRPYLKQVALVDDAVGGELVVSSEIYVLRAIDGADAAYLVPFLLSDATQETLATAVEGGHHPRFRRQSLLDLRVPPDVVARAAATSAAVRKLLRARRRADVGFHALTTER